jgi:four helix bundle protein
MRSQGDVMSRDHRKLRVFVLADELALQTYRRTAAFPHSERHGLQAQIRRGAVSVATNIVEGSARQSLHEYCHFLNIASASASEVRNLLSLAHRVGLLGDGEYRELTAGYSELVAGFQTLLRVMRARSGRP